MADGPTRQAPTPDPNVRARAGDDASGGDVKIGCLGWGSLLWNPKGLPVREKWFEDAPLLPIEFARKSSKGRLTLVIVPTQEEPVRSLWALFSVGDLATACEALRVREGIGKDKAQYVGRWSARGAGTTVASAGAAGTQAARPDPVCRAIGEWGSRLGLDAVVWTALPPGDFGDPPAERAPTEEEALEYVNTRPHEERLVAEEYIRRAPVQIDTPLRRVFAAKLGWTAVGL